MAQYSAKKNGFFNGMLYGPTLKRRILTVDKEFEKCPSWLIPVPVVKEVLDFTGDNETGEAGEAGETGEAGEDTRSPQQKAADTRKANKAAAKAAVQQL